jgi:hypothetical protein
MSFLNDTQRHVCPLSQILNPPSPQPCPQPLANSSSQPANRSPARRETPVSTVPANALGRLDPYFSSLFVKTKKRHRYKPRFKAEVLSFWLEPLAQPEVGDPRHRPTLDEVDPTVDAVDHGIDNHNAHHVHRTLQAVADHTKIPLNTLKKWTNPKTRRKIFREAAGLGEESDDTASETSQTRSQRRERGRGAKARGRGGKSRGKKGRGRVKQPIEHQALEQSSSDEGSTAAGNTDREPSTPSIEGSGDERTSYNTGSTGKRKAMAEPEGRMLRSQAKRSRRE